MKKGGTFLFPPMSLLRRRRYSGTTIQRYPLLPVALALAVGIIFTPDIYATVVVGAVFVGVAIVVPRMRRLLLTFSHIIVSVALGSVLAGYAQCSLYVPPEITEEPITCRAVVLRTVRQHPRSTTIEIMPITGKLRNRKVWATLQHDTAANTAAVTCCTFSPGTSLVLTATFHSTVASAYESSMPPHYMMSQQVVATTFIPHWCWRIAHYSNTEVLDKPLRIKLRLARLRHRLSHHYIRHIPDTDARALLSALTLGDKTTLPTSLRRAYATAGIAHVLALSGMHLGMIYMILTLHRRYRRRHSNPVIEGVVLALLWAYIVMVGAPPSAVRAGIMLTLFSLVSLSHRESMSLNALSFSAILMMLFNPYVVYDVGFQLSILSVAGILLFCGRGDRGRYPLRWLRSMLSVSLSAQLAVFPLVAYYFSRLPLLFLPVNVLVFPLVFVILVLATSSLLLSEFLSCFQVADVSLFPLETVEYYLWHATGCVAEWLNGIVGMVEKIPWGVLDGIRFNEWQVVFLYIFLFLSWAVVNKCRDIFIR